MATLDDAKTAWKIKQKQFRKNTPTRTAYLGDGQGFATSNIVVADNPTMFYARDNLTVKDYFVVPNFNSNINPQFNLPVVLGYDQTNPNIEQILGVDMSVFPYQSSASVLGGLGPHHRQHEFGGGDEVFVDPELIKIGLFTPDNPPTYSGYVQPFYYSHPTDGLKLFAGSRIESVQGYKPSSSGVNQFVTITLNPLSGSLVYRSGELNESTAGTPTLEELLAGGGSVTYPGGSALFPTIPGGEIPIATFNLTSTTGSLNWAATSSNYYHSRLFLGKIDTDIYNRLGVLENVTNVSPLPRLGAGGKGGLWNKNIHDGDFRIGRINDRQWTGTSSPSWGNKLFFSGALGTGSWNSENSDEQWIARYNSDDNVSYLRMSIGDDSASNVDAFQIGTTSLGGIYTPLYSFYSNGTTSIGTSISGSFLAIDGSNANVEINIQGQNLVTTGSLGVGTTSPSAKFQVTGTTDQVQQIIKGYSGQTNNLTEWRNNVDATVALTGSGGEAAFGTDALVSSRFRTVYTTTNLTTEDTHQFNSFHTPSSGIVASTTKIGNAFRNTLTTGSDTATLSDYTLYAQQTANIPVGKTHGATYGIAGQVINSGAGTTNAAYGLNFYVSNTGTGVIPAAYGAVIGIQNFSTGQIYNAYGVLVPSVYNPSGAVFVNHAIYVDPQTAGGVNYALYTNAGQIRLGDTTSTRGRKQSVNTKSADYTLTTNDEVVIFTSTATATLPAATGTCQTYRIVCRGGTLTIDGASTTTVKAELMQVLTAGEDLIVTDTGIGIYE